MNWTVTFNGSQAQMEAAVEAVTQILHEHHGWCPPSCSFRMEAHSGNLAARYQTVVEMARRSQDPGRPGGK